MSKGASDFKKIPYVGKATEADLLALGYTDIASLRGADPDEIFERTKALGRGSDRCILYVYRNQLLRKHSVPRQSQAKMVALEGLNFKFDPHEPLINLSRFTSDRRGCICSTKQRLTEVQASKRNERCKFYARAL